MRALFLIYLFTASFIVCGEGYPKTDTLNKISANTFSLQKDEGFIKIYLRDNKIFLFEVTPLLSWCRLSIGSYNIRGVRISVSRDSTDEMCLVERVKDTVLSTYRYYIFSDFSDCDFEMIDSEKIIIKRKFIKDGLIRNRDLNDFFVKQGKGKDRSLVTSFPTKDTLVTFPYYCGRIFRTDTHGEYFDVLIQLDDMGIAYWNLKTVYKSGGYIKKGDQIGTRDDKSVMEIFRYYDN